MVSGGGNTIRETEIGGNCEECGIFVLIDGRDRVVSQAIRPLTSLKTLDSRESLT
jgi:hypothetical protein